MSIACEPNSFSPLISGAEILDVQASLVSNYSNFIPSFLRYVQPGVDVVNATFCNITISYTHIGQNDTVNVETWLPPADLWNERFQGVGGSGWSAGRVYLSYEIMAGALYDGYATVTTDAGLGSSITPDTWALTSTGDVNWPLFENFASRSLGEEATIAKSLIESFYGKQPLYSYWNGCSQGGRQGLELAQTYPGIYDGIVAGAPVVYGEKLSSLLYWPQQYMNDIDEYPFGCEIDAIALVAINECDPLDGITDGVISDPDLCSSSFDPFSIVGQMINCTQTNCTIQIRRAAASIVNSTFHGITNASGAPIWHGYRYGVDLTGDLSLFNQGGIAMTNCTGDICVGNPSALAVPWVKLFLAKDPNLDLSSVTQEQFDSLVEFGITEYGPYLGSSDPNLTEFRNPGGKLLNWHGLADETVPDLDTQEYYDSVAKLFPDVHTFYRYFQVPGVGHCFGGSGGQPLNLFDQLRAWVENGTAPEFTTVSFVDPSGIIQNRILCPYPQKPQFDTSCGDTSRAECFSCQ
ncbi:Tannase/feruloyl esterase [Xylaria venustula]|nr:Tannase/feruloyl esterase [Xylaria venustula]